MNYKDNKYIVSTDILIITRFCIETPARFLKKINYNDLPKIYFRLLLLETFSLPSILNQKDKNFKWIILLDKRLPVIIKTRLEYLSKKHVNIFCKYHSGEKIDNVSFYSEFLNDKNKNLITIRLDDDDSLSPNFISFISKVCKLLIKKYDLGAISINNGLLWFPSKNYIHGSMIPLKLKSHAVGLVLFQKKDKFNKTVYFSDHTKIKENLRNIKNSIYQDINNRHPMYIKTRHGANDSKLYIGLYQSNDYQKYLKYFFGNKVINIIELNNRINII